MNDYPEAARTLIYLLSCAVNEKVCELKPDEIDFDGLYSLAKKHAVCSAVAFALESAGIFEPRFEQAKLKAKRKLGLFDIERAKIYQQFSEAGIWFLPLKGIVIKDFYPRYGMREMSDNDILCDGSMMDQVREIMQSLGYTREEHAAGHHDVYQKSPTLEFEMHHKLFLSNSQTALERYYENVFDRLIHKSGCEYAMSDEDLYLYLLAHEYKHFTYCGTGIRPLLDLYVYLRTHPDLDFGYIKTELEKLELSRFEEFNRELALKLFDLQKLDKKETKLLTLLLDTPLYGLYGESEYKTLTRLLNGKDTKKAKTKYFFDKTFLHGDDLKESYPFFADHKWLLPALYLYRPVKGLLTHPKRIARETKDIINYHSWR